MNINQLKQSKFLKKEDFDNPALLTIKTVEIENVALDNSEPEQKAVMYFRGHEKGLVLNSTNAQLCARALNSDETDDWIGKQIVAYNDPNVSFAGKITGGIRLRAPKTKTPEKQEPANAGAFDDFADDIPF